MSVQQHEPLDEVEVMSNEKWSWWVGDWRSRPLKQPRVAVLQNAANVTARPSDSTQSIASGYCSLNKLHDKEPEALRVAILQLDPDFFTTFPRREGTALTDAFVRAVIGEAMRTFYRRGLPAYGKPNLRGSKNNAPLPAI